MFWLTFLRDRILSLWGWSSHSEDFIRPEALASENRYGSISARIGANNTVQVPGAPDFPNCY
jgi:hypothetical protein